MTSTLTYGYAPAGRRRGRPQLFRRVARGYQPRHRREALLPSRPAVTR